jgi:hypothetical protein
MAQVRTPAPPHTHTPGIPHTRIQAYPADPNPPPFSQPPQEINKQDMSQRVLACVRRLLAADGLLPRCDGMEADMRYAQECNSVEQNARKLGRGEEKRGRGDGAHTFWLELCYLL